MGRASREARVDRADVLRAAVSRLTLVSFDIDGTLEIGDPPGVVSIALVRMAKTLGYVIGSCSDRTIGFQEDMWASLNIAPDFTVLKHRLEDVRARFSAAAYYHIGDTDTAQRYALAAGFRFLKAAADPHPAWRQELFGC